MVKTYVSSKSKLAGTAKPIDSPADESSTAIRSAFTSSAIGMSWQLALVVLIPIVGGYKLDTISGRSPLWTLIGLVVALVLSILVIRRALTGINNFDVPLATKPEQNPDNRNQPSQVKH